MKNIKSLLLPVAILFSVLFFSCAKDNIITPNQQVALFASSSSSYFITSDPNTEFKIPFGVTQVAKKDLKIEFSVTSPSGAVEGQQYTISNNTAIIPEGSTIDSLSLKGIFSAYPTGRKDTLIFKITGGDIPSLVGADVYTLVLQKYCDVNLDDLLGDYTSSIDNQSPDSYGPYTATINSAVSTGPTSGTIYITYFADAGFGPWDPSEIAANPGIAVNLDWSDPANFITTVPSQTFSTDLYGYGKATISPVGSGTFSSCENSFVINYKVTVSAGSFGSFVTVLKR